MSLNLRRAMARTVFEAGFALKTHGSLVKGLTPFLAGRLCGLLLQLQVQSTGKLEAGSLLQLVSRDGHEALVKTVDSATELYAPDVVMPAVIIAFASIAFIGAIVKKRGSKKSIKPRSRITGAKVATDVVMSSMATRMRLHATVQGSHIPKAFDV